MIDGLIFLKITKKRKSNLFFLYTIRINNIFYRNSSKKFYDKSLISRALRGKLIYTINFLLESFTFVFWKQGNNVPPELFMLYLDTNNTNSDRQRSGFYDFGLKEWMNSLSLFCKIQIFACH